MNALKIFNISEHGKTLSYKTTKNYFLLKIILYTCIKITSFINKKLLLKTLILFSFDFHKSLQKFCIIKRNVLL